MKLIGNSLNQPVVSFSYFVAFIYLLNNMELVKKVYLTCAHENPHKEVTRGQLLKEAQQYSQLTPLEINLLFSLIKKFRNDE